MAVVSYTGVVKGRTVVLDADAALPEGTGVVVTPLEEVRGSPQAVVAAAKAPPHLKHGDIVEFLRLIEEGKRPVRFDNPLTQGRRPRRR